MDELQQPIKRGRGRPRGTGRPKVLSPKQGEFVAAYLKHGIVAQAAHEAGYAPSYRARLIQVPAVAAAIAAARKQVAIKGEYNLAAAMTEAQEAMEFARATNQANAYVKAVELRAKLQGLLIERVDQRQVGGFQIRILGIDDIPAPALPTAAELFGE